MKALVISGGGSKGAFAGGLAEYLISNKGTKYDLFVGCSTGSLLVPFLALNEISLIRDTYTNVTQSDIFNISPFKIKTFEDGSFKSSMNHFSNIMMFLKRKRTFGESEALRQTIKRIYTPSLHEKAQSLGLKVVITVSNITLNKVEYKYLKDYDYGEFCDWIWASTCMAPFMSIYEKNGLEYADGGFGNYIPIQEAIDAGATELDVIILQPKNKKVRRTVSRNPFDILINTLDFMLLQIAYDDIRLGQLESIYNSNIKLNLYFTPRVLTEHSFYFNPSLMKQWWVEGYAYGMSMNNQPQE
ncbi:MAG TPA: patatin-like phospholipase family protein [Saprospiraceae bacterium]|nr:patatin-like phospholipase family protein [Saprospiraceae bacterium]